MPAPVVDFLYVNIGRGHPFYLDGIRACLPPSAVGVVRDVFEASRGPAGAFWHFARWLYARGSSQGGARPLYARLRERIEFRRGPLLRLLGHALASSCAAPDRVCVVSHPLLVAMLPPSPRLVYQHGELAVPREALVPGPHRVLVPDAAAAAIFRSAGFAPSQIGITGLCVEPALVALADGAATARAVRRAAPGPLTGGFLSSGAEPALHVRTLVTAAVRAHADGGTVVVLASHGGAFASAVRAAFAASAARVSLHTYRSRAELETLTTAHFTNWDYACAPAHERSHWALGLGLPFFMVDPAIGSFAPLNRARLLAEGVALTLDAGLAADFGSRLRAWRTDGTLARMQDAGWGRFPITGFARAAELLHVPATTLAGTCNGGRKNLGHLPRP